LKNIILSIIIFFLIIDLALNYTNTQHRHIKIKKVTILTLNNSHKNLVFTKDNGVLENTDLPFIGKFNSNDFQIEMLGKKECDVITKGYRIPFISSYSNIIKVENCK